MSRQVTVRLLSIAALALLMGSLTGCGRSMGSVTGKVTYMSKALKGGTVAYISTEGLPSVSGVIGEDGNYELPQIQAGNYTIIVDTRSLKPRQSTPTGPGSPGAMSMIPKDSKTMGPPPGAEIPEGYKPMGPAEAEATQKANAKRYVAIPDNYSNPEKSGLTFTVAGGAQVNNLELK